MRTAPFKPTVRMGSRPYLYHVESRTRLGIFYTVNAYRLTCTCEAGRHGRRCWHLALAISYDAWRATQRAKTVPSPLMQTAGMRALHDAFA